MEPIVFRDILGEELTDALKAGLEEPMELVGIVEPPNLLAIPAAFLSPTALTLPDTHPPSREAILGLLATCGTISEASNWWRGDCYLYAERHYGLDWLSQVLESADFERLKPCIWCSERVLPEHRREGLSWSHHRAIAALDVDGQVYWLDQAEEHGWTVRELKAQVRVWAGGLPPKPRVKRDYAGALALSLEAVGERWTQAHHDALAQLLGITEATAS